MAVKRTELVWEGKYDAAGQRVAPVRVVLPFQTAETVNESAADRDALGVREGPAEGFQRTPARGFRRPAGPAEVFVRLNHARTSTFFLSLESR